MDEFKTLLVEAIKLSLEKHFAENNPLQVSEELNELIDQWESAWHGVFNKDYDVILDTIMQSIVLAYICGAKESVEPIIDAQIELLDRSKKGQETKHD